LELNNKEITERVLASMGVDWSMVTPVEDRKGHDRRYSVDDSKLRAMGYEPRHKFEDGLGETIAWYTENEAWWRPLQAKAAIK
jgi:dTDP-glucose 4,6-dehydratase